MVAIAADDCYAVKVIASASVNKINCQRHVDNLFPAVLIPVALKKVKAGNMAVGPAKRLPGATVSRVGKWRAVKARKAEGIGTPDKG